MAVQWVHLGDDVLFASDRAAWLRRAELAPPSFLAPMPPTAPSTLASTRHLLDGAIAAAERAAAIRPATAMSVRRWAWHLLSQWHSAHHSVALLGEAIDRYTAIGRADLAAYVRRKRAEEDGHDAYPIADLRALGYDALGLVSNLAPDQSILAGLRYAREALMGERPVEFLGYVYAVERRVIRIPDDWFAALERVLPPGVEAASGLRAHAGHLDHAHVEEAVVFIAALPAEDRTSVATGAHAITHIRCAGLTGPQPEEDQLAAWLEPYVRKTPDQASLTTHMRGEP